MSGADLSRRNMLRGAALAPVVASATLERVQAAQTPANFIFFHTPNGFNRAAFGADGVGLSFMLRPSLAALAPYKANMSVVTGLCNISTAPVSGASQLCRLLTCVGGGDPRLAYNESIDQRLSRLWAAQTLNLFALGSPAESWQEHLSWRNDRTPSQNASTVEAAWNAALRPTFSTSKEAADQDAMVLSYLSSTTARNFARLPRSERDRLSPHLAAWDEQKVKLGTRVSCGGNVPALPSLKALSLEVNADNLAIHGRAKIDLLVAALACGTQRVATLMWQGAGPGGLNPVSGAKDHYDLSQRTDAQSVAMRTQIDSWYAAQFAYLLNALSVANRLDTTIVVWGSEVAEGQHHNNMTFVLAGGRALGLRQGVTLNMPFSGDENAGRTTAQLNENHPVSSLWQTLLKAVGSADTSFGEKGALLVGLLA